MLSYRHVYHAGNFADVHKHVILTLLIGALSRKDKPFFVLDTHAGAGDYDLESSPAMKNREHESGIGRIVADRSAAPAAVARYLDVIAALNPGGGLRHYPGSPLLARRLMRPGDRLVACEIHPQDHERLRALFVGDKQVGVHRRDGWEAIRAFVPPPERRGLVFIDPPYEVKDDYRSAVEGLGAAVKRWPGGSYALWYPLLADGRGGAMPRRLAGEIQAEILVSEIEVRTAGGPGMYGSGMIVITPPWQTHEALESITPWLWSRLSAAGSGRWRVYGPS